MRIWSYTSRRICSGVRWLIYVRNVHSHSLSTKDINEHVTLEILSHYWEASDLHTSFTSQTWGSSLSNLRLSIRSDVANFESGDDLTSWFKFPHTFAVILHYLSFLFVLGNVHQNDTRLASRDRSGDWCLGFWCDFRKWSSAWNPGWTFLVGRDYSFSLPSTLIIVTFEARLHKKWFFSKTSLLNKLSIQKRALLHSLSIFL